MVENVRAGVITSPPKGRSKASIPIYKADDPELMIGAGNGSRNTTDLNMDVHPRTGKKLRKVKIVDIRTTRVATDPYGVEHEIPEKHESKINSFRNRIINVTEIK